MTEKELEKLFRKKFEGRTFDFNPAAWEGAEKLIVAGERRRKRRIVTGWSAAASVVLLGGLMTWNALTTPQYTPGPEQMIAWPSQDESPSEAPVRNQSPVEAVAAGSSQNIPSVQSPAPAVSGSDPSSGFSTALTVATENSAGDDRGRISSPVIQDEEAMAVSEYTSEQPASAFNEPVTVPESRSMTPAISADSDLPASEEAAQGAEKAEGTVEAFASDKTADEMTEEASENTADIIQRPKHVVQAWSFGAEAGLSASILSGGERGLVPTLYGGFVAGYDMSESWGLRSGLIYSRRSGYGRTENQSVSSFGFGFTSIEQQVQSTTTDYLEVPLSLSYTIDRHQIELGGYAAFRLMNNSRVTRVVDGDLQEGKSEAYIAQGYNNGNAPVDAGVSMGYSYAITNRWRLTANGTYGVLDGFGDDPVMNNQIQFRIGARYMWVR